MIRVLGTSSEKLLEITVRIEASSGRKTCAICTNSPSNFDTNSALCTKCYSDVYSHGWTLKQPQWGGRTLVFSPLSGQVNVQIPTEKPLAADWTLVTIGPRGLKMDICYFCNTNLGDISKDGRNSRCLKCAESLEISGVSVLVNDHSTRKTVLRVPVGVDLLKQEPLLEKTSWTAPASTMKFVCGWSCQVCGKRKEFANATCNSCYTRCVAAVGRSLVPRTCQEQLDLAASLYGKDPNVNTAPVTPVFRNNLIPTNTCPVCGGGKLLNDLACGVCTRRTNEHPRYRSSGIESSSDFLDFAISVYPRDPDNGPLELTTVKKPDFTQRPLKNSDYDISNYDITAGQRKPDPTKVPAVSMVNTERPPNKELTYSQKAIREVERRFTGCEAITTAKAQSMLNSLKDKHFMVGDTITLTFSFNLGSDSEIIVERANPAPQKVDLKPDRVQYKETMQQYGDGHCTAVESAKKFVHPRSYRGNVNVCQTYVDDPTGDDVGSDY